ncbi:MAG: type I 3-dehydroquinate dehydratase [Clostridia bacterium]|nr:type I 3-dehydroquinate dehydratase [Clostridia bacterium]
MKKTFAYQKKPFVVGVLRGTSALANMATMKNGEYEGADAFDLHINWMPEKDRTDESFKKLFSFTKRPVLALFYTEQTPFNNPAPGWEERFEVQMRAIDCGAAGVDIQAHYFDDDSKSSLACSNLSFVSANPAEISLRPEIIERQKDLIERVHAKGAEVLLSSHVGVELTCEQAVDLALEMEKRGPDIVKIVSPCNSELQLGEVLKTIVTLRQELHTPFVYIGGGEKGKLSRIFGAALGNCLCFAVSRYDETHAFVQPPIRTAKSILEEIKTDALEQ